MKPSIGRIVHYTLTEALAAQINKRRRDAHECLGEHRANSNGVQIHVGNTAYEGDVLPLMIVRVWPGDLVNGQVHLDGNDLLWVTSIALGTGPGTFAWPPRV